MKKGRRSKIIIANIFFGRHYLVKYAFLRQKLGSPVVKWLSLLTLNQASEVRILAGELFAKIQVQCQ